MHILGSHQLPEEPEEFTILGLKALGEGGGRRDEGVEPLPSPSLCQASGSLWVCPRDLRCEPRPGGVPVLEPELECWVQQRRVTSGLRHAVPV